MTTTLPDTTIPDTGTRQFEVSYTQTSRAWYFPTSARLIFEAERLTEEILVKVTDPADGALIYEFLIAFCLLGDQRTPAARVKVFDESFAAFADLAPFFTALAQHGGKTVGVETVLGLLRDTVGATDTTPTRDPYA